VTSPNLEPTAPLTPEQVNGLACVVCGASALDPASPPMVPVGAGSLFRRVGCDLPGVGR